MKTAAVEIAPGNGSPSVPDSAGETHSPYLRDLYGLIDEIETLFPEVVRVLRERIADLERFLAKSGNPFIQNGAIAAMHQTVQAVHGVMKRIVG